MPYNNLFPEPIKRANSREVTISLPPLKTVVQDAVDNFPEGFRWPVHVYVRQARVENLEYLKHDGASVVVETPYGRVWVSYMDHEVVS